MEENRQSTCPSCGLETLEVIYIAEPAGRRSDGSKRGTSIIFECSGCLWQGSTATLNPV